MPSPKNAAGKHAPHEDAAKDMRRAYEHLGRVEVLHAATTLTKASASGAVTSLTTLAQQELTAGHIKEAAELLRAAEHLSFGALRAGKRESSIDPRLAEAITKEFDHKLEKAEERWAEQERHHAVVEQVYVAAKEGAWKSYERGAFRQALELARGAEALAHVRLSAAKEIADGGRRALPA